ncbi:NAC domain containing protein 57 [Euphorbia peplus]|nr:NAC domain containing protein 57 [Euphorbia peplus]
MEHGTGYRFHPSDEELVNHYLKLKMLGQDDKVYMIPEINLLKLEPWEIPEMAMKMSNNSNDKYNATFDFPTKSNFFVCKLKEKEDSEDNPASELEHGQSSAYAGNQSSENNPTQDVSHEMQACMQSFHGYEEMDYTISTLHSSGRIRTIIMIIKTDLVP